ncbi:hypothetical protein ES705_40870 [subsurface metagenome]
MGFYLSINIATIMSITTTFAHIFNYAIAHFIKPSNNSLPWHIKAISNLLLSPAEFPQLRGFHDKLCTLWCYFHYSSLALGSQPVFTAFILSQQSQADSVTSIIEW